VSVEREFGEVEFASTQLRFGIAMHDYRQQEKNEGCSLCKQREEMHLRSPNMVEVVFVAQPNSRL
jgi:hypothetical protein